VFQNQLSKYGSSVHCFSSNLTAPKEAEICYPEM
jgi:hypothetical protein